MERPISRSQLHSTSASPPPIVDDEAIKRLRNLQSLDFALKNIAMPDAAINPESDEELDFRLFAPSKLGTKAVEPKTVQKIRLRSPSLDFAEAGFLRPKRREDYYFATPADSETKSNYEASALSTEQILELSHIPWPGTDHPWKTLRITPGQVSKPARLINNILCSQSPQLAEPSKHKRMGKQSRIRVRVKLAKAKAETEAKAKVSAHAEEAERDKKTRRNREKKAKKKAREKAKKAAGKEGGTGDGEGSGSDSSDGD